MDGVVPVAMESIALDAYGGNFGVRHFSAYGVWILVDHGSNLQAALGGGCCDELDDDFVTDQRLPAPVLGNERKHAVLDLVPFARSWWKVTDGDRKSEFVRERLEFHFP